MTNTICDLSHHNASVDLTAVQDSGITAVFHKATQGSAMVDDWYARRRAKALSLGLLWGCYHFGSGDGSGIAQADHFLATALPADQDLMVLDLERNDNQMSLSAAYDFIGRIKVQTGRYPGLYAGEWVREQLQGKPDAILSNCWLWLADYRPEPHIIPAWSDWTFWQYTGSGNVCGVQGNCDRSQFNGTPEELQAFWTGAKASCVTACATVAKTGDQAQHEC